MCVITTERRTEMTFTKRTIIIDLPEEADQKLEELGFDWKRNTEEMVKNAWFEVLRSRKEEKQ